MTAGSWESRSATTWLELTHAAVDEHAAVEFCRRPSVGGIVCFSGTVRDHAEGVEGVVALHYEVADELAKGRLRAIAEETARAIPELQALAIRHRIGRVALGETAVVVAAGAAHRDDAFRAARYVIDAVKVAVPLVKQELTRIGARWTPDAVPLADVPRLKDAPLP